MATDLMISISGVRGIVGKSLTPELLVRLGGAFGTYIHGGTVVVGRDTRTTGEMVKHATLGGLLATGCRVIDIGTVATPTLTLMIKHLRADGGVMISASHNPVEWNALKFFRADASYLNAQDARDLLDIYYSGNYEHVPHDKIREVRQNPHSHALHVDAVLNHIDVNAVRRRRFKVALDTVNGSGIYAARILLEQLDCEVYELNTQPDGKFQRYPEPSFVGLSDLMAFCKTNTVDIGCALDPDADRIAFVDETGGFIGEELSLALCADHIFARCKTKGITTGPMVVNMSTSRINEDVANRYGVELLRVPVGEVNVAETMAQQHSIIGGEGNGGVIYGPVHYGRDALVGIALMLEKMAFSGETVSALRAALPAYQIVKSKIECPKTAARRIIVGIAENYANANARVNTSDGLRIDYPDRWVHLRPSNTEPILRVIAEAKTVEDANALIEEWRIRIEKEI